MTEALDRERVHGAGCDCVRCTGFEPGNDFAVRHGCYSPLRLQPRAKEIREGVEPLVPFRTAADAPLLDVVSMAMAQLERAGLTLAWETARAVKAVEAGQPPPDRLDRLSSDARGWVNTVARLLDQLGCSPTSRARLGVDVTRLAPSVVVAMQEGARS